MTQRSRVFAWLILLLPYAAVLLGMYWFKSGWLAIAFYHAGIILTVSCRREWRARCHAMCSGWHAGLAVPILCACLLAGPVVYWLWPRMAINPDGLGESLAAFGLSGRNWWLFIAYFSTVHPFLEELFWRPLNRATASKWTAGTRHLLFAGYHLLVVRLFVGMPWLVLVLVVLAAVSFFWSDLSRRREGAILPLLSHAAADLSVMLAVCLLL